MSESSPTDLAVTFRSIERRTSDALAPLRGDRSAVSSELAAIDRSVAQAASILGTSADAESVANELKDRPADSWGADLDQLRQIALEIGRELRTVESRAEQLADSAR